MFDLSIVPIIYTYGLGDYLTFLSDVFDASINHTDKISAEVSIYNQKFKIQELPKKRTKLNLDFELIFHGTKDLETIGERAEFYYYRRGINYTVHIQKISAGRLNLNLIDPDNRELEIKCMPYIQRGNQHKTLNRSYN